LELPDEGEEVEFTDHILALQSFSSFILAILVLFMGKSLNFHYTFLRELNISEPVVGGPIFATGFALINTVYCITLFVAFRLILSILSTLCLFSSPSHCSKRRS